MSDKPLSLMVYSDNEILSGIKEGNEKILEGIYRESLPVITRHILQNSGSKADAEDIFQEALIIIYKKLQNNTLKLISAFNTYIFGVSRNIWFVRLRRLKRISPDIDLSELHLADDENIMEEILKNERYAIYRNCFIKLSKKCKELLLLHFESIKLVDIAIKFGQSESYIRKRKFECKRQLISLLEKKQTFHELVAEPKKILNRKH